MQGGGLQPVCKGRVGVLGISGTGQGGAAELLKGFGFGRTLLAPMCVYAPLGLGTAMGRVAQYPTLCQVTIGGRQHVIARALLQRCHSLRTGLG